MIPVSSVYAQESKTVQVEVKYTNGDLADFYGMSLVIYQDYDKIPIMKKEMENNPESISLPKDHRYKIEVYANGMYGDVGYIDLKSNQEKININIPLSGGLQFNVFYKDGQTPIKDAKISVKSHDGTQWRVGKTNDHGETLRYWIQSTTKPTDYYVADVYLGEIHLTTLTQIKLLPGLTKDQKIIAPIPATVEDLITIILYKTEFEKVTKQDGEFSILLKDSAGNTVKKSQINSRGEAYFSSIPSKEYSLVVLRNGTVDDAWQEKKIAITGQENLFKIIKTEKTIPKNIEDTYADDESILSCNCVSFRFDDVQDYWLNDVQIAYIETFVEKNIPLTVGIISDSFGSDQKITKVIKDATSKNKLEIASQGIGNAPFSDFSKQEQDDLIKQSITKITESVGTRPQIFVPPQNKYNEDTKQVLIDNKFTHISSNILLGESSPFPLKGESLYRFPETATTGKYSIEQKMFVGLPSNSTYSDAVDSLKKYGFAVITSHPQEFAVIQNGTYTNQINTDQINELESLIQKLQSDGIKIVSVGKINLDSTTEVIPQWIKNNAGWWAQGQIDDNSFVQGIQYLIQNEIMKIPETAHVTDGENKEIPQWIKNNAGWWAQGQITDSDFVSGIEYLVKHNIITY
ncbi:MAG TPA: polysaccharide deacetylase family protein [Nitrosarchaeum sp.]|nr:polysaccharide deacetylase family protein [Nitrosarchaeum sp.]